MSQSCRAAAKPAIVASIDIDALLLRNQRGGDRPLGPARLGQQHRPGRQVVVPFDEGRRRPESPDRFGVERPDRLADGRIVRVDQKRQARVVTIVRVAGEMNFPTAASGKRAR